MVVDVGVVVVGEGVGIVFDEGKVRGFVEWRGEEVGVDDV